MEIKDLLMDVYDEGYKKPEESQEKKKSLSNRTFKINRSKEKVESSIPDSFKHHPARFIMRDDIDLSVYSEKAPKSSYQLYNEELEDFLKAFSRSNQRNGGIAITKSQLIEIVFDVIMYDMELNPIGFESHDELRRYLQERII